MEEKTYVMVKPGFASYRAVVSEIKNRIRECGLTIEEQSFVYYDREQAEEHYKEHEGKSFYENLIGYITSGRAYGMVVKGENAISKIRKICGSTKNPEEGTIRYDIPKRLERELDVTKNVVHSSDSPEAAEREIKIFKKLKFRNMDVCQ